MPLHLDSSIPSYKFAYEDASPDSGDVMTWSTSRNRMAWSTPDLTVTLPFMFEDSAEKSVNYSPPKGSFITGDRHADASLTVSGGGLLGNLSLDQGIIYGPTDGTAITITGKAYVQTLIDSDSTHTLIDSDSTHVLRNIDTTVNTRVSGDSDGDPDAIFSSYRDRDRDTVRLRVIDTVRLRVIDKTVIPSIALVTRPVKVN